MLPREAASTAPDQLCLLVSASVSSDSCNPAPRYCRSTLSAGAHPTPRLVQDILLRYVSSRPSAARAALGSRWPCSLEDSKVLVSRLKPPSTLGTHQLHRQSLQTAGTPAAACHSARCMQLPPSPHVSADQIRSVLPVRLVFVAYDAPGRHRHGGYPWVWPRFRLRPPCHHRCR